jgi:alcohol dehydrogenase class IV
MSEWKYKLDISTQFQKALNREMDIPRTIKDIGVQCEDFGKLAKMAMLDASLQMNPVEIREVEIMELYNSAFKGKLEL